jgi:hypothetical protein
MLKKVPQLHYDFSAKVVKQSLGGEELTAFAPHQAGVVIQATTFLEMKSFVFPVVKEH